MDRIEQKPSLMDDLKRGLSGLFNRASAGHHEIQLENGMNIICETDFSMKNLEFCFVVNAGMVDAPQDHPELPHLAEHMALHGDSRMPMEVVRDFRIHEGRIAAFVTPQHTYFTGAIPWVSGRAHDVIDFMKNFVQTPSFEDEGLAREKTVMETEMAERYTMPVSAQIDHVFAAAGLTLKERGTAENIASVRNIKPQDVREFFETYFHAGNIDISIRGPVTANMIKQLSQMSFDDAPQDGIVNARHTNRIMPQNRDHMDHDEGARMVALNVAALRPADNDIQTLATERVLAHYATMALEQEVRDQRGLAYNAHATPLNTPEMDGFMMGVKILPDSATEAAEGIASVLRQIESGDINADFFATAQKLAHQHSSVRDVSQPFANDPAVAQYTRWSSAQKGQQALDLSLGIADVSPQHLQNYVDQHFYQDKFSYMAKGDLSAVPEKDVFCEMMGRDPDVAHEPTQDLSSARGEIIQTALPATPLSAT
jgi:predicted Zn-dependent peptidase